MVEFKQAIKYPFKNWKILITLTALLTVPAVCFSIITLLIIYAAQSGTSLFMLPLIFAGAISFIALIISGLILEGYLARILQETGKGKLTELPKLEDIKQLIRYGLIYTAASYIITIPALILALFSTLLYNITSALISLILPVFLAQIFINEKEKLNKRLDPARIIKKITGNFKYFLYYAIKQLLAIIIYSLASLLLVTIPIMAVAMMITSAYLAGEFYHKTQ